MLKFMPPQSNYPDKNHKSIREGQESWPGIDYLLAILNEDFQQNSIQLEKLSQKADLNEQDLETLQMIEDPITRLQKLLNIPPEISEYKQTIQELSTKIVILEDRLANSKFLVKRLIPLLARNPQLISSQLDIFKALQEKLVIPNQEQHQLLFASHEDLNSLQDQVADLEAKINNPQTLTEIVSSLVSDSLHKEAENKTLTQSIRQEIDSNHEQLIAIFSSLVSQIVEHHLQQEQPQLEEALKPILTKSFSQELKQSPQEIARIIVPQIAEILRQKISLDCQAVVQTLAPIIDQVIKANTQKDEALMTDAISPILPTAISQRIEEYPQEIARSIAPEIAVAIREQIRLEREAMVDALYPIMGATVTKAIAQTIREINRKVEKSLSPETLSLRMRAKVQGVSEAELLLKESMPFYIRAVFLIQKHSGLVISTAYCHEKPQLESEMVAGMLTAIRSFVSEYIAKADDVSEINEIDYGNSQIILEVAGHCYLAVVIDGTHTKQYKEKMSSIFSNLLQDYGEDIAAYEGNSETIPSEVDQLLGNLLNQNPQNPRRQRPPALGIIALVILGIFTLFGGINQYQHWQNQRLSTKINKILKDTPELATYELEAEVKNKEVKLEGILNEEKLKQLAQEKAQFIAPKRDINNNIVALESLVNPLLVDIRLKETLTQLNQHQGTDITSTYENGKVTLEGIAESWTDIAAINRNIASIPGVLEVINQIEAKIPSVEERIYFKISSTQLEKRDINSKIGEVAKFLKLHPEVKLQIIGYSNRLNESGDNGRIARERAITVKEAFEAQGIDSNRLKISAKTSLPPNVRAGDPKWLSRCATFFVIN